MALHPHKVEWERPMEPQMWNPVQVKLLALDYELIEMRRGLLLSWPWLKWRGLCSTGWVLGAQSGSSSDARPLGFQLWNFGGFTTYRVISQLERAV